MSDLLDDSRNRPVVFQTSAEPSRPRRRLRRPAGVLAGATLVVASLAGAAGLAFGGSAVWSVVGPKGGDAPAPLWLPAPPSVSQAPTSPRHAAPDPSTLHPRSSLAGHPEPGDPDHNTAKSGRGGGGDSGGSNSGPGGGSSGSGRSPGGSTASGNTATTNTHEATATQGAPVTEEEPGHDENQRGSGGSGGGGSSSGGSGGGGSSGGSSSGTSGGSSDDGSSGGGGRH